MAAFTKSLAKELASKGITVNAVAPGFTETEMVTAIPRCVDASGNVSFGSGAGPGAVNCSQYTVRPARWPEPPSSATSTMTFEELATTCDDYARAQAASVSQSGPPASSLDATCEENMRERYRRDSGQPAAEEPR
jgi:NAD(P)-dependent dehydrogenase (short-subunit alcohol dehydrogenase family)